MVGWFRKLWGSLRGRQPPLLTLPLPLAKGKGIQGIGLNKDNNGERVGKDKKEVRDEVKLSTRQNPGSQGGRIFHGYYRSCFNLPDSVQATRCKAIQGER